MSRDGPPREICETYRFIDVREIVRGRSLDPGRGIVVPGTRGVVVDDECTGLTFYFRADTTWVALEYTDQHLGGRRVWFQCPTCGRRCALLYEQHEELSCRECRGLAYRSQRCNREDRLRLKARKIRERLSGSANLLIPFPERPMGMARRTYRYWRGKGLEAERAMYEAMQKRFQAMDWAGDILAGA